MIMQNTVTAEVRDIDPASIPAHKASLWQPYTPPEPPPIPLADYKATMKAKVGAQAERTRMRYISPGSGKAMSYQQVAAEARTYVTTNGAGVYPFLQARVDSGRYANLEAAAAGTIAIEQQWAAVGSAIDRLEDAAKLAIDAASTDAAVLAASQVEWP